MIKLSNGVEVSEETVVSALKKVGISVKPKHIFKPGDVAENGGGDKRLIISVNGKLQSISIAGYAWGDSINGLDQDYFKKCNYKYIGRLQELLRNE